VSGAKRMTRVHVASMSVPDSAASVATHVPRVGHASEPCRANLASAVGASKCDTEKRRQLHAPGWERGAHRVEVAPSGRHGSMACPVQGGMVPGTALQEAEGVQGCACPSPGWFKDALELSDCHVPRFAYGPTPRIRTPYPPASCRRSKRILEPPPPLACESLEWAGLARRTNRPPLLAAPPLLRLARREGGPP
jgi:hypothetical protein